MFWPFGRCSMAEIHVTKLAAAQRQLRAAIRMFFGPEDELAVHTVASAAYRLTRDLKKRRGHDEVGDVYQTMFFYVVRDYHRGTLPKTLADDAKFMRFVRELADALPITENTEYEDVSVRVSPELAKRFWKDRNKVFNFLKHADHDAEEHISLDEVDNFHLLMLAFGSIVDLGVNLGAEGYALWVYSQVQLGESGNLPEAWFNDMRLLSSDEQLPFFCDLLSELNAERGEF